MHMRTFSSQFARAALRPTIAKTVNFVTAKPLVPPSAAWTSTSAPKRAPAHFLRRKFAAQQQHSFPTPLINAGVAAGRFFRRTAPAFAKKHWFTLSVAPLVAFCYQWPGCFRQGGAVQIQAWKDYALAGIFLSTGLCLKVGAMAPLKHIKAHALVQGTIFLGAPLLFSAVGFGILEPLGMSRPLVVGFIFTGCLPTTVGTSIAFTHAARGHLGVSMFNVAFSNSVGIAITPLLCVLLTAPIGDNTEGRSQTLAHLMYKLGLHVLLPAAVGIAVGHRYPAQVAKISPSLSKMPQMLVLPLIAKAFSDSFHEFDPAACGVTYSSLFFLGVSSLAVNWMLMRGVYSAALAAKLSQEISRSAVFLGSQKTAALGVPLLSLLYAEDPGLGEMVVPLLMYHAVQCAASSLFVMFLLA